MTPHRCIASALLLAVLLVGCQKRQPPPPAPELPPPPPKEEPKTPEPPKGPSPEEIALKEALARLESSKPAEQLDAIAKLAKLKKQARPSVKRMFELITTGSEPVRRAALAALEEIEPDLYKPAVSLSVGTNVGEMTTALQTLSNYGKQAEPAAPLVLQVLETHLKTIKLYEKNPGKGVSESLQKKVLATTQRSLAIVLASVDTLVQIAPAHPAVFPQVAELCKPLPNEVAMSIPKAKDGARIDRLATRCVDLIPRLVAAHPAWTEAALETLTEALGHPLVRLNAVVAFGEIGHGAKPALEKLRPLKLDPSPRIREAAANAIASIESAKPPPTTKPEAKPKPEEKTESKS